MWLQTTLRLATFDKILLVIAHPDDECLFFAPIILASPDKIYILCLSTGNFYGVGSRRTAELYRAVEKLGVPREQVRIIDDEACEDGMENHWPTSIVYDHVIKYLRAIQPDIVITFDEYGVSSHPNHIAVFKGVSQVADTCKIENPTITFLKLTTVHILRKFISLLDILISLLTSEHVVANADVFRVFFALLAHKSQLAWYRVLFVFFSRYSYVNTFAKIN